MSTALASSATPNSTRQEPLRVMVVDDFVVIRGLISRWVEAEPDMVVAASLRTGLDAVNQLERVNPDVAVLDIEMPELDGISALPQLLAKKPNLIIIMASTLTRRNAEISFKALSLAASDYIPKPESTREATAAETFRHDLIQKIRHLGVRVRRTAPGGGKSAIGAGFGPASRAVAQARGGAVGAVAPRLRHASAARAPDRFLDRRPAGADDAGCRNRRGDRPFSGADHPAHAADLHDDPGRASGARQPSAGARSRRRRDRQGGPDLPRARWPPHACRTPWRRYRDRARRRTAGQFLQAGRRSPRSAPPSMSGRAPSWLSC